MSVFVRRSRRAATPSSRSANGASSVPGRRPRRRRRSGAFALAWVAVVVWSGVSPDVPARAQAPQTPDGCWEGSIGDGEMLRHAFLRVESGADTLAVELQVNDGQLRSAPGAGRMAGDSLLATVSRPDRQVEIFLGRDGTGAWNGRLEDPKNGTLPVSFAPVETDTDPEPFLGSWSGRLEAFGLGFILHVEPGPCGQVIATTDSPDQGATGLPVTSIDVEGDQLRFAIAYLGVDYEGTLDAAGDAIEGEFRQRGTSQPFRLERGEEMAKLDRPQEPKPPFPYHAEDVTIENEAAGLSLAGTLTIPEGEGPHPAAIFITGSGPQDRNEEMMGHKPFLLLADRLTRAGVAVLRTDDRGVGGSEGSTMEATLEDVRDDVIAQIEYLTSRPEIDGDRVGLLGHSEGGWVAPMVAAKKPDLAFLILLAGPGVGGEELLHVQSAAVLRASGVTESHVLAIRRYNEIVYEVLKQDLSDAETVEQILKGWAEVDEDLTPEERRETNEILGIPPGGRRTHLESQVSAVTSPWFRYLLHHDAGDPLRKVDVPVLAVLGEKDLQVPPDPNANVLRALLRERERDDVRVIVLEGLNHLFQKAQTGLPAEYARISETINPVALRTIEDWVADVVGE